MLSLSSASMGLRVNAPPWSHLSLLSNGDSRLWLSGGGGAVRAPDLGGGEETALAGGKSLFLSRRVPHSPSRRPASLSCFCFPSLRWKRRPAALFPPQPPSWWSGGRKFGELPWPVFSPLPPALGASHLWAQGRGRGAQRPGSSLTQPGCLCGPGQPGHLVLGLCPHVSRAGAQGLPTTTVQSPV